MLVKSVLEFGHNNSSKRFAFNCLMYKIAFAITTIRKIQNLIKAIFGGAS